MAVMVSAVWWISQPLSALASARAAITDPEITEIVTPLPHREALIRAAVHQAWSVRFADLKKAA